MALVVCNPAWDWVRSREIDNKPKDMARRKAVSKGSYAKDISGAGRTSDPWYMLLNESKIH